MAKPTRKLLSKAQRHAIMKRARAAQLRTMATKAYQRAASKGKAALNAWRKQNAAS